MALSERAIERVFLAVAAAYVAVFFALQTADLFDTRFLEWDARAMAITAWRFHGTRLFQDDLAADFTAAMCPPGWKALYWVLTSFVDPYLVTKLLPFPLMLAALWQGYVFGRRFGGRVLGAATAVLLCHCGVLWDRIVGANPRAFGYPLVIAFLRYASEGRERAVLVVLVLQAAFYPSALLFCAPAYALVVILSRDPRRLGRLAAAAAIAATLLLPAVWRVDARIGRPIAIEQLAALGQRANMSLYPLPPWRWPIEHALQISLHELYGPPILPRLSRWIAVADGRVALVVALALAILGRRALPRLGVIFLALFVSSVAAFAAARQLAYRLYIPDRLLVYAWPPLLLLALPVLAMESLRGLGPRRAPQVAAVLLVAFELAFYGRGLAGRYGVHDWSARDTPTIRFLSTLPRDVLIVAGLETSSDVQVFARRKTLFSAITDAPNFDAYGFELERRIGDYYRAYYARDLGELRAFARRYGVDYLVAEAPDFGPAAVERTRYVEPWTSLAAALVTSGPVDSLALASPPEAAVVFRDGSTFVLDLRKL